MYFTLIDGSIREVGPGIFDRGKTRLAGKRIDNICNMAKPLGLYLEKDQH
jgi:hypothetical protein